VITPLVEGAPSIVSTWPTSSRCTKLIHQEGGSELFFGTKLMKLCGSGLFGGMIDLSFETKSTFLVAFSLTSNLVKVSSCMQETKRFLPRNASSKILSLELPLNFLGQLQSEIVTLQSFLRCPTRFPVSKTLMRPDRCFRLFPSMFRTPFCDANSRRKLESRWNPLVSICLNVSHNSGDAGC